MEVKKYDTLNGLRMFAEERNLPIDETRVSFSVSVFKDKKRIELHIFYKS